MNYKEDPIAIGITALLDTVVGCPVCNSKDVTLQRSQDSEGIRCKETVLGICGRCKNGFKAHVEYTLTTTVER